MFLLKQAYVVKLLWMGGPVCPGVLMRRSNLVFFPCCFLIGKEDGEEGEGALKWGLLL